MRPNVIPNIIGRMYLERILAADVSEQSRDSNTDRDDKLLVN